MPSRKKWGVIVPVLISGAVLVCVFLVSISAPVRTGIVVGILLALGQSFLSTGALTWAWNKSFFYWVWAGGMLFRMIVFAGTAFVVYSFTKLNLVATLLSLVVATTLFLVVESFAFFEKPNGFPSSS